MDIPGQLFPLIFLVTVIEFRNVNTTIVEGCKFMYSGTVMQVAVPENLKLKFTLSIMNCVFSRNEGVILINEVYDQSLHQVAY